MSEKVDSEKDEILQELDDEAMRTAAQLVAEVEALAPGADLSPESPFGQAFLAYRMALGLASFVRGVKKAGGTFEREDPGPTTH